MVASLVSYYDKSKRGLTSMMVESQNQQPAVNVYPNGGNGGMGFGDGAFGGGYFWIIILFFFALFMGWGNNGNAAGGNGNMFVPYAMPYGGQNYVQQGFDQAAIMGGLNGIQTSLANAEVSRCNIQANQTAMLNNIAMAQQNCCCENRAAVADLKYTVATEACADRAAVGDALQNVLVQNNANTQRILDVMCQDKIDAKNEKIAELQNQLTMANLAASQNAQTAAILTDNLAQTQALEQYLAPVARPAYIVQNPNCCANNFGYNSGCGCGR